MPNKKKSPTISEMVKKRITRAVSSPGDSSVGIPNSVVLSERGVVPKKSPLQIRGKHQRADKLRIQHGKQNRKQQATNLSKDTERRNKKAREARKRLQECICEPPPNS